MTNRSKFEQMLECLINEDQEQAKILFHQIVVAKSREIYEGILSEDFSRMEDSEEDEDMDEAVDSEEDDTFGDEAEDDFGAEDESEPDDIGGDAGDDFIDDVSAGGEDDEEDADDSSISDRVVDLEDALDDLRAEFEAMMADEKGEDHEDIGDDEFGAMDDTESEDDEFSPVDDEAESDEFGAMDDEPEDDEEKDDQAFMREYIEKVTAPKGGDNGANSKSIVAKRNNMGGTAANIATGKESGAKGTAGGLLNPSAKEASLGNINVPGGNAGKTAFKKREAGHGAEKKGTGDRGDANAKSIVGSASRRTK